MKKNEIFRNISDEDAAKIADEYPTGDKKQRDRLFKKVEERVNGTFTAEDDASGTETYRPRIAMKVASAAAALVVTAGVAGIGWHLLRNNGSPADSSFAMQVYEASTEEETTVETFTIPAKLTKEEVLNRIKGRDYASFDRINMKYRLTENGVSFLDGSIKRDGLTGSESVVKTWTHTPEYFKDIDPDILTRDNTTPEELAKNITRNEMFFAKDMFICVYGSYGDNGRKISQLYEIVDRSNYPLDQPTIFSDTFSESIVRERIDHFEIQDITENTTFLGRSCTDVLLKHDADKKLNEKPAVGTAAYPSMAPTEDAPFDSEIDQVLSLTVDNETGIILRAKLSYGSEYYEEFEVSELLFNDDAELPENGEYIRNRLAECSPINDSASYDLSVLD